MVNWLEYTSNNGAAKAVKHFETLMTRYENRTGQIWKPIGVRYDMTYKYCE
jgi:hypothetical protein